MASPARRPALRTRIAPAALRPTRATPPKPTAEFASRAPASPEYLEDEPPPPEPSPPPLTAAHRQWIARNPIAHRAAYGAPDLEETVTQRAIAESDPTRN